MSAGLVQVRSGYTGTGFPSPNCGVISKLVTHNRPFSCSLIPRVWTWAGCVEPPQAARPFVFHRNEALLYLHIPCLSVSGHPSPSLLDTSALLSPPGSTAVFPAVKVGTHP